MENIKTVVKNVVFFATLMGIYYLFVYSAYEGISFPLEITVLPSLALALGLLSAMFTIVTIAYSTIFAFVVLDPWKIGYAKQFYTKPHRGIPRGLAALINFFFYFCFTPVLFIILAYTESPYINEVIVISMLVMPFFYSWYILSPQHTFFSQKFKTIVTTLFAKTFFTYLFVNIIGMLSIVMVMKYVELGLKIKTDADYFRTFAIFFLLSFIILHPPARALRFKLTKTEIAERPLIDKLLSIPAFYVYVIAIIFAILPPVVRSTSEVALRFLNIGGGIERSYFYSPESKIAIPPEAVDRCEGNFCITKKVKVSLDLGGLLYIKGDFLGTHDTILSLPRQHLSIVKYGK